MLVSLGFLLVIVAMSAFLAVLADNVGRKLGKKRLSLRWKKLSIRPKHMAMIGTALTGAGVSLVTIIIVAAVSKDVREWIVRGQAAIAEAEGLVENNHELAQQIAARENTIISRDLDIKAKNSEIRKKTEEISKSSQEVAKQREELARLNGQIAQLRLEVPRLRGELERSKALVLAIDERLSRAKARLAASQRRLAAVNESLRTSTETMNEAVEQNNELNAQNLKLLGEQTSLTKRIKTLEEDIAEVEATRNQATEQLGQTQRELAARQADLSAAQAELATTEANLQRANLYGSLYKDISYAARFSPLMFNIHEEVARVSVEAGANLTEATSSLDKLLRAARIVAADRGAKSNNQYAEAGFVDRRDSTTGESISVEDIRRQLVSQIRESDQPLVLVAYSSLNAFKGEPVSLDVVLYPNPVVYRPGQVVAETRVDGRQGEVEIYRQISELVGSKVRERARMDRMIPRSGTDENFGSVSSETLLRLLGDVKASERTVRLQAMAAVETRAGDPLKLTFKIQ